MGKTLAVVNQKGGTGETTARDLVVGDNPALIPASIALAKADVELMAEPGSSWVLKESLAPLRDDFDLVLLDCPPTLTLLTVNALAAADTVLIPVKTDLLSTLGISQLLDTVQKVRRRANPALAITGILPTLCNARFAHDGDVLAELKATYGDRLRIFEPIRRTTLFDRAAGTGSTTIALDPTSDAARAYAALAAVLLEIFDEPFASPA